MTESDIENDQNDHDHFDNDICLQRPPAEVFYTKIWKINRKALSLQTERIKDTIMENSFTDKIEWTLIFAMEFGRHFGLTLKQAFNYLNRFGAIKFVDDHYDYCHTQSFQSMVSDMAEYCHRKGGALV